MNEKKKTIMQVENRCRIKDFQNDLQKERKNVFKVSGQADVVFDASGK